MRGETVCCAGVTEKLQWRRLYPVHFRRLRGDRRFSRWQWIEYDWRLPSDDKRPESRRIQEDSLVLGNVLSSGRRAGFLAPVIRASTDEAKSKGETLTLIRPISPRFSWRTKTSAQIEDERTAYDAAARQKSFFDAELRALAPCPYEFNFNYKTTDGKSHTATCDDWETAAMFYNLENQFNSADRALQRMNQVFNVEYPRDGFVFALGTHSRRPDQWLLVGVIRLDETPQMALAL